RSDQIGSCRQLEPARRQCDGRDQLARRARVKATGTAARTRSRYYRNRGTDESEFSGDERQLKDVEAAARVLGLQLIALTASTEREMERAFATMAQKGGVALLVGVDPFFLERRDHIVALARRHAIPAIYPLRQF